MNLPKYLDIELNTNCNLHCKECPYHKDHASPEFMRLDLLYDIMDQIDWKPSIKFCQRGEPLLSAILIEAIKTAHKKGLRTVINTNGFYLKYFAGELIKAGLTELILSDYGHPQQFQQGCIFSATNQFYDTSIKFTVKTDNPLKWKGIAQKIIPLVFHNYSDTTVDDTELPKWKCHQLYDKLVIEPNGSVRCCCGGLHPQKYVGSVLYNSLQEIWESSIYDSYRKIHDSGLSHRLDMCKRCAYRKSFIK